VRSTRSRIGVLAGVFGAAFVVVVLHLWLLMVHDHDAWARRSHENRWSFKAVPSLRGALLDRFGRVLAEDEPTTELALHYVRFRLRHPVGAAVHGAIAWARVQGDERTTFGYADGANGPADAMRTLLAMPARALRPRALEKHVAAELASAVTTVLAVSTGQPRSRVFAALREAALAGSDRVVGDVLGLARSAVIDGFLASWRALQRLDRDLLAAQAARLRRPLTPDDEPGLLATLESLRADSLAGEHVTWKDANGVVRTGSKVEAVRCVFASQVPFDLAAELRVAGEHFPGVDVLPSVRRARSVPPDGTLNVLLGQVRDLDRSLPGTEWLDALVDRSLPDEWLADLDPPEADATFGDRERLHGEVRDRYRRELVARERRGTSGVEAAFDDALMGRLGLRLVEHDARHREQQLWAHLRVEGGDDVRLTLDVDLQRHAETAAAAALQRELHGSEADRVKVEAAVAVIDANTGDVLAYAGEPINSPAAQDVPGVVWQSNGSIGSVVKPFVLVEQVQSETLGRAHRPIATLDACSGSFRYGHTTLGCTHAHWDGGRDAVQALGESCNLFFYQCALGLGDDGVQRALRRFGLAPPPKDGPDAFAACWQPHVRGIPAAAPQYDTRELLPRRAIGYGVACSPLHVARAYAALATGALPTLGLRLEARPRVPLDDVLGGIGLAREGLRYCVERSTAKKLTLLRELGVEAKTGTAAVTEDGKNNAWFAGYLPPSGTAGVQLCFCAVVYFVADGQHGAEAAGELVSDLLRALRADPVTNERYLLGGGGR
jgi:cell division protein FtsI/penicillin-binding protein 2